MKRFTKEWYAEKNNKTVVVNGKRCKVANHSTESRGGSWERGFRFYSTSWAMLVCTQPRKIPSHLKRRKCYAYVVARMMKEKDSFYSMDHGKTWHPTTQAAMKSKGKLKLTSSSHGEFAFEGIQRINRSYDPSFVWSR